MKSMKMGVGSGCVVWILLIGVLSMCILSSSIIVGIGAPPDEFTLHTTGKFLCPAGSTPETYVHEWGVDRIKDYEIYCVDADGHVMEITSTGHAFLLEGIFMLAGLIIAVGLLFAMAAPHEP